ncbi:hypothetical protein CRUP_032833, partial [Coryphaenoides rupestris]
TSDSDGSPATPWLTSTPPPHLHHTPTGTVTSTSASTPPQPAKAPGALLGQRLTQGGDSSTPQQPFFSSSSSEIAKGTELPPYPSSGSQERKRPRKPSHRILECTIEEVSFTPGKKKPSTPTGSKTPKQEAEDGCSGVEEEEEEEGRRQTLANGTPALQPEVESPGVNNSFCSHVDVKGRTGATTLRENVCQICERAGELVLCEGQCYGAFHPQCLGLAVAPKRKFLCRECRTGAHACFVCKKAGGGVKRCLIPMCGKFYHS